MSRVTPQQMADRWTQGLSGAGQRITDGINNVKVAPTQQAANAKAKMLQNVTAAINSGKWEAGLKRVSLTDWQNAMINKGVPRIASGAQAANSKMANFAAQLLPYQDTLQSQVKAMPSLTLSDNTARAVAWITGMAKFQKK